MTDDLLEQLAETEVPPVPAGLTRDVHDSVNRTLLIAQLADLALRGMVFACGVFARGVIYLLALTVTGKSWEPKERNNKESESE